jgi:hypothetical protein
MLRIVVGEADDVREFFIHEALLTARSKFFEKRL